MLLCTFFALFVCFLNLRTISKYKPTGAIWRGDLMEVFFAFWSLGGLFLEGLIHAGGNFQSFMVDLKMRE